MYLSFEPCFKNILHVSFFLEDNNQDPCMNNLCENGAACQADSVGGYKCICKDGFEGRYCQGNKFPIFEKIIKVR